MLPDQFFILIEIFNSKVIRPASQIDAGLILLEGRKGPTVAPKESGARAWSCRSVGRSVVNKKNRKLKCVEEKDIY